MPLAKGSSNKAINKNIETEMHVGKGQRQSVAIAMQKAGRHRPGTWNMKPKKSDMNFYGHIKAQTLF